ncbi:DUF554 domain-containing protein [Ureibacillus terrenus]|uniref:DUF554 domain-containing protein n=1 Tax=Ureibacillus terrenus TaxID=118246 RepID=UPI002E1C9A58|nr:DUF554 domain-containing protein [Ureibacillus terrenus]MED3763620.1 DUF554 domain-containing protein [Ureibacillus terrenus]
MILFGTVMNAILIMIGSIIGRFLGNMPEKMKSTVLSIIGLAVALLGIQMGMETGNFIILIISLVVGAVIGEWIDLDTLFNRFGKWVESKIAAEGSNNIVEGFITASLIFVIGSMGVIGAMDSGLRNDHDVLIMKGIIDGFTAIILTSTLGMGVMLSAFPVLIYEGIIALFSGLISKYIPEEALNLFIQEMTATGGVMIFAIGLNIAGLTKIRVANLLPGIAVVAVMVGLMFPLQ